MLPVYVIAVLCALEVKEEVKIEEKQIVKQPVSVADDDETDF